MECRGYRRGKAEMRKLELSILNRMMPQSAYATIRKYRRLPGLNNRNFSHSSGCQKSKNQVPVSLLCGEGSLPGQQKASFLLYSQRAFPQPMCRGRELAFVVSCYENTKSIGLGPNYNVSVPPYSKYSHTERLELQHKNFGGTHTFSPFRPH